MVTTTEKEDGMGGKTGEERNTLKEGDPKGRRHLREKTYSKRVVSTKRRGSKREKTQVRKTTHDKIVVRN